MKTIGGQRPQLRTASAIALAALAAPALVAGQGAFAAPAGAADTQSPTTTTAVPSQSCAWITVASAPIDLYPNPFGGYTVGSSQGTINLQYQPCTRDVKSFTDITTNTGLISYFSPTARVQRSDGYSQSTVGSTNQSLVISPTIGDAGYTTIGSAEIQLGIDSQVVVGKTAAY